MPKRSRNGDVSNPARVVAPTRVKEGTSSLMARAAALPHAEIAEPGFGASDCPSCPAHLVRLMAPKDASLDFDLGCGEVIYRP